MVHYKRGVKGRAALFAERQIKFKFSHAQIEQIAARFILHPQIPFQTHETHESAFEIPV